jgi:aerobic carbon-monoxide dehydrogenase small subunit
VCKQRNVQLRVNGIAHSLNVWPMERLLDVLRHELHLTGTKEGCGEGECGACAVLLDGVLVNSCLVPIMQADGAEVTTVEGVANDAVAQRLQTAFIEQGAIQCGFCTPGMLMAAVALLKDHACPSESEVRAWLSGCLCRCTGYGKICESVLQASVLLPAARGEE